MSDIKSKKIVVAVTGASGSIYASLFLQKLEQLKNQYQKAYVVMSKNAEEVWSYELENTHYKNLPFENFELNNFYAPFASGSGKVDTMIIIPCSMGTIGRIANGISTDLISRAADVILKEKRKLICVLRETPYNLIHINNIKTIAEAGGIICPANPSFYSKPKNIEDVASTIVDRVLDLCGLEINTFRWSNK